MNVSFNGLAGLTAGTNACHRAAPLAMALFLSPATLLPAACKDSLLTHLHPVSSVVSAGVVLLCRALIEGVPWPHALDRTAASLRYCDPMYVLPPPTDHPDLQRMLPRIPAEHSLSEDTVAKARQSVAKLFTFAFVDADSLGRQNRGGYAPVAVRAALFFVNRATCASAALSESISFAGPANYCPVLVGAISGARWGLEQVKASGRLSSIGPARCKHSPDAVAAGMAACKALADHWEVHEQKAE